MGFFEFLGEYYNPGPAGSLEPRQDGPRPPKKWVILLWGLLSIAALSILLYWMIESATSMRGLLIGMVLLGLYLLAGFYLQLRVPSDNIGLWGTPVDHPFRISDDMNRFLIIVAVFLFPGKLISQGVYHLYHLFAGK